MTRKKYDIHLCRKAKKVPINIGFHRNFDDETPNFTGSKEEKEDCEGSIMFFQLYRFSTISEKISVVVGLILATFASLGVPYTLLNSGEYHTLLIERHTRVGTSSDTTILKLFGGGKILTNASKEDNMDALRQDALSFGIACLVGTIVEWVLLAASVDIFNRVAGKQVSRIRKHFLTSILRQDMSWYDTASDHNFTSKMTEDLSKLKDGIGEKVAIFTNLSMSFFSGMTLSLFYGWNLFLAMMACCPVIIISAVLVQRIQNSHTRKELKTYCAASSVAEEVFSGIRTVFAFGGERKESERYNKLLLPAIKAGHRKGLCCGICSGIMWIIIYFFFAMALYYTATLAISSDQNEPPAVVVTILLGIILEAQSIGFALPHLESFAAAKSAGKSIFAIIDRKSDIDPMSKDGVQIEDFSGNIDFEKVQFKYPSRPDVEILKGLSLSIKAGQTVAFVGPSGCGKTTCLQLLQRFYDPEKGSIKFDTKDIRELNVAWLRSQIGVVGQEPVLFSTTIEENIRYGNPSISREEIEEACKMAYCHDFICQLPDGYSTMAGEMGCMMSGGQKQRIAIARALVKNPKILLLDEATSALDSSNEKLVQKALNTAGKGRTTLMVAHRLSTVRDADTIIFVKDGAVVEQGNHNDLMTLKGFYYSLVKASKQEKIISKSRLRKSSSVVVDEKYLEQDQSTCKDILKDADTPVYFRKFLKLNAPEWKYLFLGCSAAILHGSAGVIWSIYFGEFIGFMSDLEHGFEEKAFMIAMVSLAIGILTGITNFIQVLMLNVAGVNLTSRLRQMAFKSIVSQDMSYFDDQNNSTGALCSRLSGDCANVQEATGSRLGVIIQSISTLSIAIIMSLTFSWNLTLVTLVMVPIVVGSVFLESNYTELKLEDERIATENASQLAVEAVANIRTINSLGQEKYVLERFSKQVDMADAASTGKKRFRGLVYGFGDASQWIAFGISLCYGGFLVADGDIEYKNIIKISEALQLGTWMLGQSFAYAPNISEASQSVRRLLTLFDRVPDIKSPSEPMTNEKFDKDLDINYKNVGFNYPTRKLNPTLKNFNLKISKGSTVALVGASGCGKSTCVQLLLRFYDPTSGSVNLNAVPTNEYELETLRSYIGLVSQEPVLFDRTIAENIAYGDNSRESIPMTEIIDSAKKSNIHEFIASLPQGYGTSLSSKGSQLSCGQKQRIAIARALIRNPRILILDEATSALDTQSEKVVQEALDAARSGRTCLIIAQRLATIRNADVICVIENGRVKEQGTHEELLKSRGVYAELLSLQQ